MKKLKRQQLRRRKAFAGKCKASGGLCFNPLCVFGCIDSY